MSLVKAMLLACVCVVALLNTTSTAWAAGGAKDGVPGLIALTETQPSTGDFEPVSQLPQTEQLPAAPLLVGAYIVVWLVILVYLLILWRRMAAVDREIADIERRLGEQRRS
jgi:CcmD family protein